MQVLDASVSTRLQGISLPALLWTGQMGIEAGAMMHACQDATDDSSLLILDLGTLG